MAKSPFKLRKRVLSDGRTSLFIDHYEDGAHKYEFLQLYLLPGTTSTVMRQNARTLRQAETIVKKRTEEYAMSRAAASTNAITADILLSEWIIHVYTDHKRRGLRNINSLDNTRKVLAKFRPEVRLSDIDRQFCLDFIDWLRCEYRTSHGKTLAPKSADTYSTTLRTVLNDAVRAGILDKNPWNQLEQAEKIKVPPSQRAFLTIDEVRRLMDAPIFNQHVKKAYLFSCFCGLRVSDIRKLRWRDISTTDEQWTVSVIMTKTDAPVYIPLSSQAVKWLPERGDAQPDDLVFHALPNMGNICANLKSWAKAAGIKKNVTFHTARHTCATMLLTLGADIYTVSKILGHRSIRATQIYSKIIDSKKADAVALIDNAF